MAMRRMIGAAVLVMILLLLSGCSQPDKTVILAPVNITLNISASALPEARQTEVPTTIHPFITTSSPTLEVLPVISTAPPVGTGNYVHYAGPDYTIDYPATWETNLTTQPLREYIHNRYGCSVTLAWQLDQELRMYYSRDGSTLFYSSVVSSQIDIWPRNLNRQINYADVVNSILGNPDYCANTPMESFTISGVTEVPLDGVSYTGTRIDFGKINATGFVEGTGSSYIVTGKNRRGVFTFYSTSLDRDSADKISRYMFNSLRLDAGF
nr:hypothetical protein [uncultured Methanoregula sp.]